MYLKSPKKNHDPLHLFWWFCVCKMYVYFFLKLSIKLCTKIKYTYTQITKTKTPAQRVLWPRFFLYIFFYTSVGYIYGSREGKKSVTPPKHKTKKKEQKWEGINERMSPFSKKKKKPLPPLREKHQQKFHHKSHIVAGNKKESLRFFFHFPFPLLPRSLTCLLVCLI